jgi:hypothetical protein
MIYMNLSICYLIVHVNLSSLLKVIVLSSETLHEAQSLEDLEPEHVP